MTTYQINLPDNIKMAEIDIKMIVASKLFELGVMSSGQAAGIVGITKRKFIESLAKYKVNFFNTEIEELLEDIANA
jgi:hypothetical protein